MLIILGDCRVKWQEHYFHELLQSTLHFLVLNSRLEILGSYLFLLQQQAWLKYTACFNRLLLFFFSLLRVEKQGCLIIRQNHDTMHYFPLFLKAIRQHIVVMEIDFSPGKAPVEVPIFSSILLNNFSSSPVATKVTAIPCVPVQSGR